VKPRFAVADALTALRFPLAVLFPVVRSPLWQLAIVAAAAASDVGDGLLARRYGSSRAGAVLDPIADKFFMVVAFVTIAQLLTLVAAIADWTYTRHLAWATAAIAVYALWDYGRTAAGARAGAGGGGGARRNDGAQAVP